MSSSKSPEANYATRSNIKYPGTLAQANVAEGIARQVVLDELGGTEVGTYATLTTALTGTHNDITLHAREPGTAGNGITLTIVGGTDVTLLVSVSTLAITVRGATTGTTITTTGAEAVAAINASATASVLVYAQNAPSNTGAEAIVAASAANLTGGSATNPSANVYAKQLTITPV